MLKPEVSTMPHAMRSIFAVMFGFMVMILSKVFLTFILLRILGPHPDPIAPSSLSLSLAFTFLAAGIGGYVAARVDPFRPILAAFVLAGLIFALALVSYRHHSGFQALWYQLLMLVAPPFCALGGAALYARRVSDRTS